MKQSIDSFFESIRGKRIALIGMGRSHMPLIPLFTKYGATVIACDKRDEEALGEVAEKAKADGAELSLGEHYLDDIDVDIALRTPGMRFWCDELNALREKGVTISSEMEIFFDICPCKIYAVTGSDGKTTTTSVIAEMLRADGYTVHVGGNIGKPLLPEIETISPDDVCVVELSSFQLISMRQSPDVAVVTNLAPNHLDIHKDMEEYVTAKENLYLHQGPEGRTVLNLDNDITRSFIPKVPGELMLFSRKERPEKGYYLRGDNVICRVEGETEQEILPASEIKIPGVHNIENYMAAFCCVYGLVPVEVMVELARTFGGVAHRIQLIREKDGVRYYDSSIDSSPNRTRAALRSFPEKVIMIAGGKDKGIGYDDLGPDLREHVKLLVLTGMTAGKIRAAAEKVPGYDGTNPEILDVEGFDDAIRAAAARAKDGDVVILSPASTSFDRFRNFEERGLRFQSVVNSL